MTPDKPFGSVPSGALQQPTPFELQVDEQKLQDLKTLLKLSPIAKETYENLQDAGSHGKFGVSREWILNTKKYWEEEYNWRTQESHINSFPNFKSTITDDNGATYTLHFAALFSLDPAAIPIGFFHGWPGSFLEFLPLMHRLREKYTPDTLPYHIIAPSLPGFALSASPPLDRDWKAADTSRLLHKLMLSLGFGTTGYLAQGGDIGSRLCSILATTYPECKAIHLNTMFNPLDADTDLNDPALTAAEKKSLEFQQEFMSSGMGYLQMHRTRPSTIGIALASSPVALLAWIGEKFLAWTDPQSTPGLDAILSGVSLYWFTECYPSCIYTYRELGMKVKREFVDKPTGYSWFPCELTPTPRAWAEKKARIVFFRAHEVGGHFAALERPAELLADVEAWAESVWKA